MTAAVIFVSPGTYHLKELELKTGHGEMTVPNFNSGDFFCLIVESRGVFFVKKYVSLCQLHREESFYILFHLPSGIRTP